MDNKQIQVQLRRLAKNYKHADIADVQALATQLRALETFNPREIKILVDAAKADVLEDLATPTEQAVQRLLHERLTSRLLSESDSTYEEARWAVETWAKVLSGKATKVEHAQSPKPALSWDTEDTVKPKLTDLRTAATPTPIGNALPAYQIAAQTAPSVQPAAAWPPPALSYVEVADVDANTSGSDSPVPEAIAGFRWNWGAFLLSCWWLMFNGLPVWGIVMLIASVIPFVGILNLAVAVYIGLNGHGLAWRHRRFESVEHYITVQRAWMRCGILLALCWWGLVALIAVPNFIRGYNQGRAERAYGLTHPGR